MPDLSPLVMRHLLRLFAPADQFEAARLLRGGCSPGATPALAERLHCAALKLSQGRIDRLYDAIALPGPTGATCWWQRVSPGT